MGPGKGKGEAWSADSGRDWEMGKRVLEMVYWCNYLVWVSGLGVWDYLSWVLVYRVRRWRVFY